MGKLLQKTPFLHDFDGAFATIWPLGVPPISMKFCVLVGLRDR